MLSQSQLMPPKGQPGQAKLKTTRVHFKNILLATDFSKGSEAALCAAAATARQFDSNLDIVNVTVPGVYPPMTGGEQFLMDAQIRTMQDRMKDFVTHPSLQGVKFETAVEWGASVVDRLLEVIREKHIDMAVVSSHGATGIERMLLGSVAEMIVRNVQCPVMVIGPNAKLENAKFKSVLLATDLELHSLRAAQYATALAEEMHANITLLHVVESPDKHLNLPQSVYTELEQLLSPDVDQWCQPKLRVEFGEITERVLEVAELEQADLIILATKGQTFMSNHAPWSHFSNIVNGAKCPVMAVQKHL